MKLLLSFAFVSLFSVAFSELVCDGKDQTLVQTTPLCPLTCQTVGKVRCLGLIEKPSCQCTNGKIMNSVTKQCVAREECPKTTGSDPELLCSNLNEHRSETTPACPSTCNNRNGMRCMAILMKPSCQCNAGTIRDTVNNKCVAPEECPK